MPAARRRHVAVAVTATFGERLWAAVETFGPLCVGLDPSDDVLADWGVDRTAAGVGAFAEQAIDALDDRVGIVKPQAAFFERFGAAGMAVLESVIATLRAQGTLVILDAKRNDIGSSTAGYAEAYFGDGPARVDALTVNPYLGVDALRPCLDAARAVGGGLFVLARTSNPEAELLQSAQLATGERVYEAVIRDVGSWNDGVRGLGSFGVVVGATVGADASLLIGMNGPVLAPGLGAQGARPDDLAERFGAALVNVIPSSSRGLLAGGRSGFAERVSVEATACRRARDAALKSSMP